jgi:putative transposase
MARLPRLTVAGHVHHVIQRGNNRQLVFARAEDRVFFLELLEQNARAIKVAVHGYVLMDDHFHLLLTPETPEGLPQLMQAIGRRYVRYFNTLQGRSGTLWEGRFRSTVLEAATQLLPCMA